MAGVWVLNIANRGMALETYSAGKQYALGRSVGGLSRWGHDLPRNDRHGRCMSDMLKARSPKLSPDVTGKKS